MDLEEDNERQFMALEDVAASCEPNCEVDMVELVRQSTERAKELALAEERRIVQEYELEQQRLKKEAADKVEAEYQYWKALSYPLTLSIRVGSGDPLKKGTHKVHTYETIFTTRGPQGNSLYAPLGVFRSADEYAKFRDIFQKQNRSGAAISSEFPRPVPERDEMSLSEAEKHARLEKLTAWSLELLEVFGSLPKGQRKSAREGVFEFFNVNASVRDPPKLQELKSIVRHKLFEGFKRPVVVENARFAKAAKVVKKPPRPFEAFAERQRLADYFEHRFNSQNGTYYMFNPHTGEVILDAADGVDRHKSHWMPPDPFPDLAPAGVSSHTIYPCYFASRQQSRPFNSSCLDKQIAAVMLTALARGGITRSKMRQYHSERYQKVLDKHSGFFYILDRLTGQTSWTKPRLCDAWVIKEQSPDLRFDSHTAEASYCDGPVHRSKLGKKNFGRYKPPVADNDDLIATQREPPMLDLEGTPFRVLALWIESNVDKFELYAPMKQMHLEQNWETLLLVMRKRTEDVFCQMYCCFAFSRMSVEMPGGRLYSDVVEVMQYLMECLEAWHCKLKYGCNQILFLCTALLRILENHESRVAFFSTKHLDKEANTTMSGDAEEYIENKVMILCKILRHIPVTVSHEQAEKGFNKNMMEVARPTIRGSNCVEVIFQIIGVLLHERETRELLCEKFGIFIIHALRVCITEPFCLQYGLRCVYNSVYLCRLGWEYLVWRTDMLQCLNEIKNGPMGGDSELLLDMRRVELALAENGWAGHVEESIEKEMVQKQQLFLIETANSINGSPGGSPSSVKF